MTSNGIVRYKLWFPPCYYKFDIFFADFLLDVRYMFSVWQEYIQAFITSIITLEANHVLEVSKDRAGARVIEAFLVSSASAKQKQKLVVKYDDMLPYFPSYPEHVFFTLVLV